MNRLKDETSPYLQQHASNPVHWFPWCDAAFEKAIAENKPIFLSIGYSTCHWCHVMARESFEDAEVAELLNAGFISIKVDREERPDIDQLYMNYCAMTTGSGGWPLTVFLTHERYAIAAGTYFPKHSVPGKIGLVRLLPKVLSLFRSSDIVKEESKRVMELLATAVPGPEDIPNQMTLEEYIRVIANDLMEELSDKFDKKHGGIIGIPKFPQEQMYIFLIAYYDLQKKRGSTEEMDVCLGMIRKALLSMRCGGIFDQIGYGFHRYSIDSQWLVPHYEKMLYNQAMMAILYAEAFARTKDDIFKTIALEVLEYVSANLKSQQEATYISAEDAEQSFYVWRGDDIQNNFDGATAERVKQLFCVEDEGNFTEETAWYKDGNNILHLDAESETNIGAAIEEAKSYRSDLLEIRAKRKRPACDGKVLTDWNGLMVVAMIKCANIFEMPDLKATAEASVKHFEGIVDKGRIPHSFRGETPVPGFLEDYAFTIWAFLEFYGPKVAQEPLQRIISLMDHQIEHFWDEKDGGFFKSPDYLKDLPLRLKDTADEPYPSGNSVSLLNLKVLSGITGQEKYVKLMESQAKAILPLAKRASLSHGFFLSALL